MDISNEGILQQVMQDVTNQVITIVSEKIELILKENIIRFTYQADYWPNRIYEDTGENDYGDRQPSFEFMDAFHFGDIQVQAKQITRLLFYDWENRMTVNQETHRHWQEGVDTREVLAQWMDTSGIVGNKQREPFWTITMNELDEKIDIYFKDAFQLLGIQIA